MEQGEGSERSATETRRRLSTEVSESSLQLLSRLKTEWGLRSRGAALDRLLAHVFPDHEAGAAFGEVVPSTGSLSPQEAFAPLDAVSADADPSQQGTAEGAASISSAAPCQPDVIAWSDEPATQAGEEATGELDALFNETGALVLVHREGSLEASLEFEAEDRLRSHHRPRASGIDLPGFVQRNSAKLRRSLHPPSRGASSHGDVLPSLAEAELVQALKTASDHWFSLYGQPANEAVIEASMLWLARDIWTQSDQSEGEAFTWTLAQHLIAPCAPSWPEGPPTLERVIVLAGLLEDPFSASTLSLRIPTLIRRFVHRFRRRRNAASFQTLEHTMTLHGALKLLQIPIDSGQRLTLPLIREAYHEMAMNHHPDAGGSVEMMRRLNEAYQLLKELYRNKED